MGKREQLRLLKIEEKRTKIERNIYFFSGVLFFSTVIINILNIIYYPYLLNGLILEINISMVFLCSLLFFKRQKHLSLLEDKKIELKIKYFLNK